MKITRKTINTRYSLQGKGKTLPRGNPKKFSSYKIRSKWVIHDRRPQRLQPSRCQVKPSFNTTNSSTRDQQQIFNKRCDTTKLPHIWLQEKSFFHYRLWPSSCEISDQISEIVSPKLSSNILLFIVVPRGSNRHVLWGSGEILFPFSFTIGPNRTLLFDSINLRSMKNMLI